MRTATISGSNDPFQDRSKVMTAAGNQAGKKKAHHKKGENRQGNTIYMGGLRQNRDMVSEKFALAQKRALRRVMDQFQEDMKLDEEMAERNAHVEMLQEKAYSAQRDIEELDGRRSELMKQYGIDPDSQEQRDLELRQKANAAAKDPFNKDLALTEEEKQRLAEMPPLTDYQKDMLECDEAEKQYRQILNDSRLDIRMEKATIEATRKALLKVSPMADAQREADGIMESASRELLGALFQEGVDQIKEDLSEMQEKMAENRAEALEEKIQREKMKKEEAEKEAAAQEMQETILSAESSVAPLNQQALENLQTSIRSMIQDQIVLDVDMKGLRVNKQI